MTIRLVIASVCESLLRKNVGTNKSHVIFPLQLQ